MTPPIAPTQAEIRRCLPDTCAFPTIVSHASTASTNTDARALLEDGTPSPILVSAIHQTSGRGRRGNTWNSPPGAPVLFSVALSLEVPPGQKPMLSPAAAIALAESLEDSCRQPVGIKWPNDLVINQRKVCGILLESCAAGSVDVDQGQRTELLARLASSLVGMENRITNTAALQSAFERRDVLIGQTIQCVDGNLAYSGRVHEISLVDGLTLDVDGELRQFSPHTIRVIP
jgi:hypothetical protein